MLLQNLPPELIERVFTFLCAADILNISWCCQRLRSIANSEHVWVKCARREYSINLKQPTYTSNTTNCSENDRCTSARLFCIKILMPMGPVFKIIWKLTNFKHYGGLAKICYYNWCIYLVILDPPPNPHTHKALQPEILCKLYLNTKGERTLESVCNGQGLESVKDLKIEKSVKDLKVEKSTSNELTIKLLTHYDYDNYDAAITPMLNLLHHYDNAFDSFRKRFGLNFIELAAERFRHRVNFQKEGLYLFQPLKRSSFVPPICPIAPGVFKGTYSVHGIEIINLTYEDDSKTVTGRKVSGDPNIPCDQITFQGYLDKPMVLKHEEQISFDLIREYMTENAAALNGKSAKPSSFPRRFNIPYNCRVDATLKRDVFRNEIGRFQSQCQIAFTDYTNPTFIKGNLIIFSENIFGVMFIDLQSLGIFERIVENLLCTNFMDILPETPTDLL